MSRYRRRLEIVADVLDVVRDGAKKTRIMYQANLSYRLLTRYLKEVVSFGLVRVEEDGLYELTAKGYDYLQAFKGYRERRVEVEEQLNDVDDEKTLLENRFLNAHGVNAGSKNLGQKGKEKRVQ